MTCNIGKKIRLLRLCRNMTQEQLAEKLCVTAQSVSKWENEVTLPDIQLLPQLSLLLGVTIDELFSMTDEARLQRIEKALDTIDSEEILPGTEFEGMEAFLKEHREDPALRGRVLTAEAELYLQQGRACLARAASAAREAIEFNPDQKSGHSALCNAAGGALRDWYLTEHQQLIAYYEDFTEKHPNHVIALQNLLDNLIADHRTEEAEAALVKLEKAGRFCGVDWYRGKICLLQQDLPGAGACWREMVEKYADDWLAWSYRGDAYAALGRYDEAVESYRKSTTLQRPPRFTDNHLSIARIALIRKDYAQAAESYRNIMELIRTDWHIQEGSALQRFEQLAKEMEQLARK